jgi:lysine 2,3-aminomutase
LRPHETVDYRSVSLFKDVSEEEWNDWKWQLRNAVRDIPTLSKIVRIDEGEKKDLERVLERFKMAITPYYAAVMDRAYKLCSVRLQAVPSARELEEVKECLADPLHEDVDTKVKGITHRYPDRVLFLVTNVCAMYCRHCTRRRVVGRDDHHLSKESIDQGLDYIRRHEEVRDVLLSGGDPFLLSDHRLEAILKALREIDHVEIVRIGTRTPVVLPQRITPALCRMLARYHPLYVNTQFNHYSEIKQESKRAVAMLADAGIQVGNQTVLLRDVNDCPRIMKKLMQELLRIRVRPYYLYQCDLSEGIAHFRTSIAKGMEIIENLVGNTTGMACPTFVVDAPGGGGKIPVMPSYMVSQSDRRVVLRNYEGVLTTYTQPENPYSKCWCELCKRDEHGPAAGVGRLLGGEELCLEPAGLKRRRRNRPSHPASPRSPRGDSADARLAPQEREEERP